MIPQLVALAITPEERLFGLDPQFLVELAINLVNVGVLAFILTKLLYKPVRDFLQKREDKIKSQLDHAEKEMARVSELKMLYEQRIKGIDQERDAILDDARRISKETSQRLLDDAKQEAEAIKERAKAGIEMEWERVQSEMKQTIIEVSTAMAQKLVLVSINKDAHDKLFNEAVAELEEMSWRN